MNQSSRKRLKFPSEGLRKNHQNLHIWCKSFSMDTGMDALPDENEELIYGGRLQMQKS